MTLPVDLTDLIIDLLANDRVALHACSRVCRAWSTRSRHYLFSDVVLDGKNSDSILSLPQPSAFSTNARRLMLTERHSYPPSLEQFSSVTTLYILNSSAPKITAANIPIYFSQITSLELNQVIFEAFADIIQILCALPHLGTFTQYMCLWTYERGMVPAGLQLPERLHTLNFISMSSDLFFEWFNTLETLPPIATACLYGVAESNMRPIGTAIKRLGGSIQHLTLDLRDHGHADLLIESIDLSHNPNLLSFTLLNAWPKLLKQLLSTHTPCSSLQHASLAIYEGKANIPNLDLLDWNELDDLVTAPTTAFRLTDVTIRVYAHQLVSSVTEQMVTNGFMPLSGSKGLVKFVSERQRILNRKKTLVDPISRRSWAAGLI